MRRRGVLPAIVAAAAIYFALFGGEYSLFALRRLDRQKIQEEAAVQELSTQVDSLRAWQDSLQHDPATLERIARERYGMTRKDERLYRFADCVADADSAAAPDNLTRC